MEFVDNKALSPRDVPSAASGQDTAMFKFAATFDGYRVWGGFESCALVANSIDADWRRDHALPDSLTLLRTALYFESRRERFVDFGGFGDNREGWEKHRRYMRVLLDAIRRRVEEGEIDDEGACITAWLEGHQPPKHSERGPAQVDDATIAAAVELASRMLAVLMRSGVKVDESEMRRRLGICLTHLTGASIELERGVPVKGFQRVGPVDVMLRDQRSGDVRGLIECKWSVDPGRDKIYEAAWDAIKLSLADAPGAGRWLVTGAPEDSWQATETADLFRDGEIETSELWARELYKRGPNGGMTVGADCEAGGHGNMFTHAPERLEVTLTADVKVPGTDRRVKAARIARAGGRMVSFHDPPEFPRVVTQDWLRTNVPTMSEDQFGRLVARLRAKRWTDAELAERVHPLRAE
ncbi:MAG TPA: hypothetical protein VFH80_33590 [Solirubrobacteraceae bacterium]|nr:hypothetical protein [Solirubrobacteraceae bacterium]